MKTLFLSRSIFKNATLAGGVAVGNSLQHVNQSLGSSFDWVLCRSTEHRWLRLLDRKQNLPYFY